MAPPAFVASAASAALTSGLSHLGLGAVSPRRSTTAADSNAAPAQPRFYMASSSTASRRFFVGGNWKCNLNKSAIADLVAAFNDGPSLDRDSVDVVVAPPSIYVDSTRQILRNDFAVSAQNSWISKGGAFTGELDATMIKDVGAEWVILGHSERRHIPQLKEADETIAQKAKYALEQADLGVIYCIGELLQEREAGQTIAVCERQLTALNKAISDWSRVVLAYEPVWAIGTGKVATPEQAEDVHRSVRSWLKSNVSQSVSDQTRILYGGSVSPENCVELAKQDNIDGFLVGGASMKPTFLEIIDSYKVTLAGAV